MWILQTWDIEQIDKFQSNISYISYIFNAYHSKLQPSRVSQPRFSYRGFDGFVLSSRFSRGQYKTTKIIKLNRNPSERIWLRYSTNYSCNLQTILICMQTIMSAIILFQGLKVVLFWISQNQSKQKIKILCFLIHFCFNGIFKFSLIRNDLNIDIDQLNSWLMLFTKFGLKTTTETVHVSLQRQHFYHTASWSLKSLLLLGSHRKT